MHYLRCWFHFRGPICDEIFSILYEVCMDYENFRDICVCKQYDRPCLNLNSKTGSPTPTIFSHIVQTNVPCKTQA